MGLLSALKNECPRCHIGKVFLNSNLFSFFQITKMNDKCPNCGKNFHPEIGFYYGAMFMSYGIASLQGMITILFCYLYGNDLFDYKNLVIIGIVMAIMFPFSFRLARLFWLHLFGGK